jgi:hypothetical protein
VQYKLNEQVIFKGVITKIVGIGKSETIEKNCIILGWKSNQKHDTYKYDPMETYNFVSNIKEYKYQYAIYESLSKCHLRKFNAI